MSRRTMQGRRSLLVWTVLALLVCLPASGATVDAIPRLAPGTWSVDTTGTLRPETLEEVDRLGTQVDASGQGQLAVVVVDSTEGAQPRAFATDLFNRWGLGHADRDDGVLLFVALSDRKAEIILGDGVDTASDVGRSDALMARLIPFFARGELDGAVLEGAHGLGTLLAQAPLNTGAAPDGSELEDAARGDSRRGSGLLSFLAGLLRYPLYLLLGLAALVLLWMIRNSDGPWTTGGSHMGGSSSGSSGGGSFGGGSSSGSGSSGSW
jgi:uncharacterized membrane protein YgcG